MNMANDYMDRGMGISHMASILHIPGCSFYRNNSGERSMSGRGRVYSSFKLKKDGDETTIVDNSIIVNEMEKLLSKEFVCYGYMKTAKHLNRLGYIINRKKVRILMAENRLLNHSYNTGESRLQGLSNPLLM
jgi:putative transposase